MGRTIELSVGSGLGLEDEAKVEVVKAPPKKWQAPVPRSGVVRWNHADKSGPWCTALVTNVGTGSIDVMIFPSGLHMPQPMNGCKFVGDPSLKLSPRDAPNPGGIWDFTDMEREVREIRRSLQGGPDE